MYPISWLDTRFGCRSISVNLSTSIKSRLFLASLVTILIYSEVIDDLPDIVTVSVDVVGEVASMFPASWVRRCRS